MKIISVEVKRTDKESFIGHQRFLSDFVRAKKEIRIDIPGPLTDNSSFFKRLNDEIDNLKKRGVKVFIRVKSKDFLPDFMRKYAIVNNYIYNPVTIRSQYEASRS